MNEKLEPAACPHCGALAEATTCVSDPGTRKVPEPGSVMICMYCAGLGIFTEDGQIRKMEEEEFEELPFNAQMMIRNSQEVLEQVKSFRPDGHMR